MKFLSIILLLTIVLFTSCQIDKRPTVYITQEMKTYYNYQPGSYWVYYDSVSGEVDSFWVTSNSESNGYSGSSDKKYIDRTINFGNDNADDSGPSEMKLTYDYMYLLYWKVAAGVFSLNVPYTPNVDDIKIGSNDFKDIKAITPYRDSLSKDTIFMHRDAGVVRIKGTFFNKDLYLLRWKIVK